MNATQARELATAAVKAVTQGTPGPRDEGIVYEPVADTTVVNRMPDGTYVVTDNGEEVSNLTAEQAIEIIVENLTAPYNNE